MPVLAPRQLRPKIGLSADLPGPHPSAAGPLAAFLGGQVRWVPLAGTEPDLTGLAGYVRSAPATGQGAGPPPVPVPVTDPDSMNDPAEREHFAERVFAHGRLMELFASDWRIGDLVEFHTNHKLQLFSHDPNRTRALGRLVAHGRAAPTVTDLGRAYEYSFAAAMATPTTRGRWVDVLQHASGYLPRDDAQVIELRGSIDAYRAGDEPLDTPLRRLTQLVYGHGIGYLIRQTLFDPIPRELEL